MGLVQLCAVILFGPRVPSNASSMTTPSKAPGYLHGFSEGEEQRLRRQARIMEHRIHVALPFQRCQNLLEVGSGVGAQTEILLRTFPDVHVTSVEYSETNLDAARRYLAKQPWLEGRHDVTHGDGNSLDFSASTFDGAFLCWILEHVQDPARVLSEVRRCLRPGSPIVVNEVQNASFFLSPYSPFTLKYWAAFNDHQFELGGDPFVGAKLGNLLQRVGFSQIETDVRTVHLDNRRPAERAEFLQFWSDLLLSGCENLKADGKVDDETVAGMQAELKEVGRNPDAVFYYSFVQARARTS
ncbi:MAG: ubiquinone/menaquinone biosynthesis C-methylase UbiE [Planctomycetota bacterium]|jgi:ubiquinone/menaquinone biosynthesis C-methylase UbiE